jgi:thymidylate synthase
MHVIRARNANQALPEMMHYVRDSGLVVKRDSRNGPVLQFAEPFCIKYQKPTQRVVFWEERDANPFFHLFESLWMIAGRNDVAYPARYSSNIAQFSDDGHTFHGAYGYRWRKHFQVLINPQKGAGAIDQVATICDALSKNPEDRRQVLQMWDAAADLGGQGKDLPCNLMAVFNRAADGALNMVVYNRSNDIVWGALGANCVHFSMLQEFMAKWIGCEVGEYWQVSANMHAYTELTPALNACLPLADKAFPSDQVRSLDPYEHGSGHTPLISGSVQDWQRQLNMFLDVGPNAMGYHDPFFRRVAIPLAQAYEAFSDRSNPGRFENALNCVYRCSPCDWKVACISWLMRRQERAQSAAKAKAA